MLVDRKVESDVGCHAHDCGDKASVEGGDTAFGAVDAGYSGEHALGLVRWWEERGDDKTQGKGDGGRIEIWSHGGKGICMMEGRHRNYEVCGGK